MQACGDRHRAISKCLSYSREIGGHSMPIIVLTVVAQLFCAWHIVTSGRDKTWLWLVIMVPGIGCAIYVITQVIPDAGNSHTGRKAKKAALKTLDPHREYREAVQAFDMVESVENRLRLADALYDLGKYDEAEPHLTQSLVGAHKSDPHILMRLASVRMHQQDPETALALLEDLQKDNPGFQSQDGHMLYSRALEELGRTEEALESYEALAAYATGEEARVRFGLLLLKAGHVPEAQAVFDEVIKRVNRGTKFYRKDQKDWKAKAEAALLSCQQ